MVFLIYVVPVILLVSSLMGTWFLSRMIIKLDEQNKPILQGVMNSIEKTNEISRKVDHVFLDGQKSRQHQQKLFEHDRILLASLNSQVAKLDVMMRVASQGSQNPSSPPSGGSGLNFAKPDSNKQPDSPTDVSRILKLDCKSLPKTEQGVRLLEQLYKRRQLSDKSEITQETKANESSHSEQLIATSANAESTIGIPGRPAFKAQLKDESEQKPQAPHKRSNPRTILNLFAAGTVQSSSETQQERRRA